MTSLGRTQERVAAGANTGYLWAAGGVGLATACFWLVRAYLDKGQASLLYLPVVIACAIRYGFGPAIFGAALSFLCWNFFFLPPFYTFTVADPKDWISLIVFLLAAVTTAQLAARARLEAQQAQAREAEIAMLFHASESLTRVVPAGSLLGLLAGQLQTLCHASRCLVFGHAPTATGLPAATGLRLVAAQTLSPALSASEQNTIRQGAEAAYEYRQTIGFGQHQSLWTKALNADRRAAPDVTPATLGVYVPLQAEHDLVGVLHVGPREDGLPFSPMDERLILTLANHAAVVIAREELAHQAAQAQALREADTLKDSLLSLVSHELRTPLATIKASVTGMLDPRAVWDNRALMDNLRAVNRETDRLSAVVGSLLDLSRLEAGAWRPLKDWCDIAEIVGTVLDRLPDAHAARVQVELADDLPLVRADYTQIALVLTNLLENAVKYTPAGTPISLIGAPGSSQPGEAPTDILLAVRDFGPGIAPGEAERLFERFYRGQAHQSSAVHGTGLGLALCQAVVHAHGGRIWAGNAPAGSPRGAVFSVSLPLNTSR